MTKRSMSAELEQGLKEMKFSVYWDMEEELERLIAELAILTDENAALKLERKELLDALNTKYAP